MGQFVTDPRHPRPFPELERWWEPGNIPMCTTSHAGSYADGGDFYEWPQLCQGISCLEAKFDSLVILVWFLWACSKTFSRVYFSGIVEGFCLRLFDSFDSVPHRKRYIEQGSMWHFLWAAAMADTSWIEAVTSTAFHNTTNHHETCHNTTSMNWTWTEHELNVELPAKSQWVTLSGCQVFRPPRCWDDTDFLKDPFGPCGKPWYQYSWIPSILL